MNLKLELPEHLFNSMMFATNGETYVKAKDIEKYWRIYSNSPVRFIDNIYIQISRKA